MKTNKWVSELFYGASTAKVISSMTVFFDCPVCGAKRNMGSRSQRYSIASHSRWFTVHPDITVLQLFSWLQKRFRSPTLFKICDTIGLNGSFAMEDGSAS